MSDWVAYHGDKVLVSCNVGDVRLNALVPSRQRPEEDETVTFVIRENSAYVFDRESGHSLLKAV